MLRFGLGAGVGLAGLLRGREAAAAAAPTAPRSDTAVILVYCHGGPSQLETWDPKPDAPPEFRGPFKAIETSVSGLRYSEVLPKQAKVAHLSTLIRSVHHRAPCHDSGPQTLFTGHEVLVNKFEKNEHPDCFCITSKFRQRPGDVLPAYVGIPSLGYSGPAYLGPSCAPFVVDGDPNSPTFEVPNLSLRNETARRRLDSRRRLLTSIDDVRRDLEENADVMARDRINAAAIDLVTCPKAREAFDLTREADALRDRYGRNRWGQQMLLARRLVEAGVSAVTTSLYQVEGGIAGSWDDHAVNWDTFKATQERSPNFDQGVAALIQDLHDRGLNKKVLLIVMGEFGRTPRISYSNGRPGRDHWPSAMSILVSGGGFKMGQVIGSTDARGEFPDERPLHANDFLATIYHHLGIPTEAEVTDRSGRPLRLLDRSGAIPELMSGL